MTVTVATTMSDVAEIRDMLDEIAGKYTGIATAKNAIVSRFDTAGFEDLIGMSEAGAKMLYDGLDAGCRHYAEVLKSRMIHRLMLEDHARVHTTPTMSRDQILEQLLVAFWNTMDTNTPSPLTVRSNVVTLGSLTEVKTNANAGSLYKTIKLPGHVAPTIGGMANLYYFNKDSELTKTDTCFVECVRDSNSGYNVARGYEQFRISGFPSQPGPFSAHYATDGDGTIAFSQPVQGRSIYDLSFDTFTTTDNPDGWTISSGAAGAEITEESAAAEVLGGTGKALRLTGTCALYLPITGAKAKGRSQMLLALNVRKDGAVSAGTFTISVTGTGFTTVTTGALTASAESATVFATKTLLIAVPASIPSDFRINISTSGITGGDIIIDHGGFAELLYWNGIGIGLYSGHDSFTIGDTIKFTATNDYAGDAQTTWAKCLRAQLPSLTVGYDYG